MGIRRKKKPVREDRIYLGRIAKPHGLDGELKFSPFGCDIQLIMDLENIFLEDPDQSYALEWIRGSEKSPIMKLKTIDNRNLAEALKGKVVWIQEDALPALNEDEFYESDFLFKQVVTDTGKEVGRCEEIIETGATDVLVVRDGKGNESLLPINREVIKEVRLEENLIVVTPLDDSTESNADNGQNQNQDNTSS